MEYRREIDGLRALAVVPVILYHAGIEPFSGGFVGVDVFFVISGYLITAIILAEKQAGTFSLLNFYERRVRRILPALFAVMFASLPFAWYLMVPHELKAFSQSLMAVSLFSSNVLFWKQSDYFDPDAALKPLIHTWSLGVEEQYYLLFPILLMLTWRFGKRWLTIVLSLLALLSLIAAQWGSLNRPEATFYLLPTRGWELFVGSFIAIFLARFRGDQTGSATRQASNQSAINVGDQLGSALGLLLIAYGIFGFTSKTPFPGFYALVPTVGAALIILFAKQQTVVGKLLASKIFVGIGLVSYSIYLWHQPMLSFIKISNGHSELGARDLVIYFTGTLVLSVLAFKFIETPFRRKSLSRKALFASMAICAMLFCVAGYLGHKSGGFQEYKLAQISNARRALLVDVAKERELFTKAYNEHIPYLTRSLFDQDSSKKKVLLIGDSTARDLATTLFVYQTLFPNYQFQLLLHENECMYESAKLGNSCSESYAAIQSSQLLKEADLIVIGFLWKADMSPQSVSGLLSSVQKSNKKLIVLGSASFLDMASVTYGLAKSDKALTQDDIDKVVFNSRRQKFERGNTVAAQIAQQMNVKYVDRKDWYCDYQAKKCAIVSLEKGSVIWDDVHLSNYGRKVTADKLLQVGLLQTQL